ncbi:ABC transporter permease [Candidatus Amarobacter glycogenicus]|uniref:ABC transporter permease n=1 Tax=Candidatus Amarobacter glycogenicus TaxID=3140699 RepID=UPI002A10C5F3|nr:ABC transporter permease [Dehalococcoidia bacterium]
MTNYIIRRLLLNLLVLWFVASLVFIGTHALPSDFAQKRVASTFTGQDQTEAIASARRELGLDKPLARQYVEFMGELARGDLGTSLETQESTWAELGRRVPTTLELGSIIVFVTFALSIPIGVISAAKQNTWIDLSLRAVSILGVAMPVFFVAILLSLLVVRFSLFEIDVVGHPHLWTDPAAAVKLYVIPAIAGGISGGAGIMRILRSQMLEVMRQDYIRTARAKGLHDSRIWVRHALKNAMLPVLTVMGLTISGIVGGQIILETMFNIDGVGRFLFSRLNARDFPPFQGTVLVTAFIIVTVNLAVDLTYAWIDPRIRYT